MRNLWQRIRAHWNQTDTVVIGGNSLALVLLIGNVWWESSLLCHLAAAGPLCWQASRLRTDSTLARSFALGAVVGLAWPLGEGITVHLLGWWGEYLAPGPRVWDTPVYCILIGWLATAYIDYIAQRVIDIGISMRRAAIVAGLNAFVMGLAGENLFAASGMWRYAPSNWDWWNVPAFVPIAYGIAYAALPMLRRLPAIPAAALFCVFVAGACAVLGLLAGFFPR